MATFIQKWARRGAERSVPALPLPSGGAPMPPGREVLPRSVEPESDDRDAERALAVLNEAGVRTWQENSSVVVGVWSDLDGQEVREALRVLGMGGLPVRHLDDPDVPLGLKVRSVPDQTEWISPAEAKARMLNNLFARYGVIKRRGRITAATVLHGEAAKACIRDRQAE